VHAEAQRCWCASRARSGPIEDRHCTWYGERGPRGTGTHTFRFLGRKVQAADNERDRARRVNDSAMRAQKLMHEAVFEYWYYRSEHNACA
jgi:hypothetical protein